MVQNPRPDCQGLILPTLTVVDGIPFLLSKRLMCDARMIAGLAQSNSRFHKTNMRPRSVAGDSCFSGSARAADVSCHADHGVALTPATRALRLCTRRDFKESAGVSTRNQLIAAHGRVVTAAAIANTIGCRMPNPKMISSCCI